LSIIFFYSALVITPANHLSAPGIRGCRKKTKLTVIGEDAPASGETGASYTVDVNGSPGKIGNNSFVMAAITSCTNTFMAKPFNSDPAQKACFSQYNKS